MTGNRYRIVDYPQLLRSALGRIQFFHGIYFRLWPLLSRLARLYRRTVVKKTRVVAVVGSFGKTTTTRAVSTALARPVHPRVHLNCWTYVAGAVLRIRRGDRHAVMEVGINGPGQMEGYAAVVRPDIAVVTRIGSEHHRSLGALENTRHEKANMVRALPENGLAVLNGDDPNVMWMAGQTRARVITFGLGENNDIRASKLRAVWPGGMKFTLHRDGSERELSCRFFGEHMVYPVLAAVAVADAQNLPLEPALQALETMSPADGRLQPVPLPNGAYLLRDDYKSTLETVHAALDVFGTIPADRRGIVMGEVSEPPGSQGPIYRDIGRRMAAVADYAVLVGGNYQRYAAGARQNGMDPEVLVNGGSNVLQAAEMLRREIRPGDVVLIKGRDTQRLERIALLLSGRAVGCDIGFCDTRIMSCGDCPMLERGWEGLKVVI